ncbi:MAG: hypothetical protein L0229_29290 [Blastocatellia bacterium]|nr:hypothetical protein [Blastocatellia bacterium]
MDPEELRREIEFLLERDTRFRDAINAAKEIARRLGEPRPHRSINVHKLTDKPLNPADSTARFEARAEADRQKIREAINKLDADNEVTRALTEEVQRVIAANQHSTKRESKLP